jgi:predicted extracellular nuclease
VGIFRAFIAAAAVALLGAAPAYATSNLVISQVYGGGGNSGATYTHDFIEVFNRGTTIADLSLISLQYGSTTGNLGANSSQITDLSGLLAPGQYLLVQEAQGAGGTTPLSPDVTDATPIAMSATGGKVALVDTATGLNCGATATPCGPAQLAEIFDLVGYDGANMFEGAAAAPALTNTTAALRATNGCVDTDNNAADFAAGAPNPRNRISPTFSCGDEAPSVAATSPANGATDVAVDSNIVITFSEPVDVSGNWYSISCSGTVHTATVTGGPTTFTLDPDANFAPGQSCAVAVIGGNVSDQDTNDPPDNMTTNYGWSFDTVAPPLLVVSQVYGGGGNSGATLKNDFIEVFNRGTSAASLGGWSVQYASAAGTMWQRTDLTPITLQPGQYYLVQEAAGAGGTVDLPAPDAAGGIAMAATAGKVALVSTTTTLAGGCPTGGAIVDFVGYGSTATCFEGSGPTPAPSNTTGALRNGDGCIDTDNNAADFLAGTPNPRNTAAPFGNCLDQAPFISARTPTNGVSNVPVDSDITVMFSEPVNVSGGWYSISCGSSGTHTAMATGGPTTFTINPDTDFGVAETCTVSVFSANVTDQDTIDPPDNMAADDSWSFSTVAPPTPIHDIQGAAHISPKIGQSVSNVNGIVTAKRSNGYYMQDPSPDSNEATSEGIFVFTSSSPTAVSVGDDVRVSGNVQEFRPGGASSANLTTTELSSPSTTVLSSGNPLPSPTIIGAGGRVPPTEVIEDDATGDVETSGVFDPGTDGIDFYESLEGMRAQVNNPVAAGPTNSFGELPVLADDGAGAGLRTARGGIVVRPSDFNPERITLDDTIVGPMPLLNVGDHLNAAAVGVMDYNFGLPMLELTALPGAVHDGVTPESTAAAGPEEVSVGTFNFENLDPTDPPEKFARLAGILVNNLKSPDIVSGEEVQDNNGPTNDSVVDANVTLDTLAGAIQDAGGPTYEYRYVNPVDDQDGGEPGGNIRQVFLFRTDRGLSFVDRPGGTSTNSTGVTGSGSSTQLTFSPGRIDPTNSAFTTSRKPLAGEFLFNGHRLFVIANHFNSKGGDQPLFGHFQPPTRSSEVQRHNQAQIVHDFVQSVLTADGNANVVVAGDLNDFEFSETVSILKSGVLEDLMDTLPQNERYSYVFEGNSQTLDHILLSDALFGRPFAYDVVHVNSEFADQASDHEPSAARITLNDAPTVSAGGPYAADEGTSITLSATGSDPEGGSLSYAWDLDGNGTFETPGQSVTFSAADGPASPTVAVQATDDAGLTDVDEATVAIENVAPTATLDAPATVFAGFPFTLSLSSAHDPSAADVAAGFSYAFDCGNGYGAFGPSSSMSCPTNDVGSPSVGGKIQDKDGGVTEYGATVHVIVTFASLCDLVRAYTTDSAVADDLCLRLVRAERASNASARSAQLASFRDKVDKSGAFTSQEAATLKLLSTRLPATGPASAPSTGSTLRTQSRGFPGSRSP